MIYLAVPEGSRQNLKLEKSPLFILVSILPQFFLAFVCGDLAQFSFSSAGHLNLLVSKIGTVWGRMKKKSSPPY